MPTPPPLVLARPAETGTVVASTAVVLAYLLGLDDPAVLVALTVLVGVVPAAITWLVVTIRGH